MKKIYVSPKIEVKYFSRQDVADVNMIVSCSPAASDECPSCGWPSRFICIDYCDECGN